MERRELLLEKTWEHLLLSGAAMGVALVLAVPLGIWLGHLHRGSFIAINAANIGRAPSVTSAHAPRSGATMLTTATIASRAPT